MFGFIKSTEKIDTSYTDYGKDKTLSLGKDGESFGVSVFGNGFAIDEAFSDILKAYDLDGNNFLDETETKAFQKAIIAAAGEDGILDNKELNRLFTKSEKTTEQSEKNAALFKALVISLKNGPESIKSETDYEGSRYLSSLKEDGSGVKVQFFKTNKGNGYSVEILTEGGKRKEWITCTNVDCREGADNSDYEKKNITSHILYNDEGNVTEQSAVYSGDNRINPYIVANSFKYDTNGNLVKKY